MADWHRSGSGLYVPAGRPEAVAPGGDGTDRPGRSSAVASWVQAVAAIAATVVSTVALIIAVSALRDQQQVNGLALDRFERRYAERVSWWATRRDRGTVVVQNRSPVPALDVTLQMVQVIDVQEREFSGPIQRRIGVQISDLPPCTMTEVDLTEPAMAARIDQALGEGAVRDQAVLTYAVRFHDGIALWERQRAGLVRLPDALAERDLTIIATTQSTQPVTDCGTDG
ncbi:hypothetical protein O7623_23885 [Solwaraspora sp. WMMD791]|uniref:hypothetical protein n=1 Tax=Solwaraspora sp. WMMD791 TaxID=3016086 RepID=UPI00249C5B62|nr:hypothetical protein [Solwaraspora sp. WMMD791]WFE26349.1 hypothetical protein O7623_23885 [Solwaraspora sp. WMMD791]